MGVKFRPMGTFNNKAVCINNYLHWQLFALLREISQRQLVKDSLNIIHLNIACCSKGYQLLCNCYAICF